MSRAAGTSELREALRSVPQFAALPDSALDSLIVDSEQRRFSAGEAILAEGEASDSAYAILKGEVIVTIGAGPDKAALARLAAPALVGEIGALAGLERTAAVTALSQVEALPIDAEVLIDVAARVPRLPLTVVRQLGRQVRNVNRAIGLYTQSLSSLDDKDLDPEILDALAHPAPELAGFATTFRRMADRIREQHLQNAELTSAALIQQALLPGHFDAAPLGGRADFSARMRPARLVGGDFYDIFMLDENRLAMLVGDVCGKGVPAALFMAVSLTVLRLVSGEETELHRIVARANRLLCAQNVGSMFATVFFAVLDLRSGNLEFADCGHNPALHFGAAAAPSPLRAPGVPLGIFPDYPFRLGSVALAQGDTLLIHSDGVTEAEGADGEEYGEARLAAFASGAARASPPEIVEKLFADVAAFAGSAGQFDDITCIVLRRL
ncbi:MAG: SpoIIE family protein phosphatase [Cucumibacter sp.]